MVLGVLFSGVVVVACSGSGSDPEPRAEPDPVTADLLRDVTTFDVAAGDDRGWLLIGSVPGQMPAEVWEIGGDGTLTRRARLTHPGLTEIATLGGRPAVLGVRCTEPAEDEDCPWAVELVLVGEDGSVDDEITVITGPGGFEDLSADIVGRSDAQMWVGVDHRTEVFAVMGSGEVERVPVPGDGWPCVVDGELLILQERNHLFEPETGPPPSSVTITPDTLMRTTVRIEARQGDRWQMVPGSERTFETRGNEARASCGPTFVEVNEASVGPRARWTLDGGWSEAGRVQPPPPGSVGVSDPHEAFVWSPEGDILRRRVDGVFEPTGVVVVDPDGGDDAPDQTQVDEQGGTVAACARFHPDASSKPLACHVARP